MLSGKLGSFVTFSIDRCIRIRFAFDPGFTQCQHSSSAAQTITHQYNPKIAGASCINIDGFFGRRVSREGWSQLKGATNKANSAQRTTPTASTTVNLAMRVSMGMDDF